MERVTLAWKVCVVCGSDYNNDRPSPGFVGRKQWAKSQCCSRGCEVVRRGRKSAIDRFWGYVDKKADDDCWPWMAYRAKSGHGQFAVTNKHSFQAHRVAYVLTYGEPAPGLIVRHMCGKPACCNPKHLAVGTTFDNCADARAHGVRLGCAPTVGLHTERPHARKKRLRQTFLRDIENKKKIALGINPYSGHTRHARPLLHLMHEYSKPLCAPRKKESSERSKF